MNVIFNLDDLKAIIMCRFVAVNICYNLMSCLDHKHIVFN